MQPRVLWANADREFQKRLDAFVREEDAEHANGKIPVVHVPKRILFHVPGCQLRAFVLSDSCLETNRRLSENTNTGSVWTRAVEDVTLVKMQNKPAESLKKKTPTTWDWLLLQYIIPKYIL